MMKQMVLTTLMILSLVSFSDTSALEVERLRLNVVATPPSTAVAVTHAGDERLFVTLREGQILILKEGAFLPAPFLDIRNRVNSGAAEQGLLSAAFHPNYAQNGFFYVAYTVSNNDVIIARFDVSGNPDRADANSEKLVMRIPEPFNSHNGGQLQFGPDGYLYISSGDGGSVNDPECNAQDTSNLLGTLLRIDVDQNINQEPYHGIPADNPFVDDPDVRDEIWVLGLRNPWRFSFDRQNGALFIGDVGQFRREEVNFQPAVSGGGENYGWKRMEGTRCANDASGCESAIPECGAAEYTPPILEYTHDDGNCAVTGGYVYRGGQIPELDGAYLYGDYCSGRIWVAENNGNRWVSEEIPSRLPGLTSFGETVDGEIYIATEGDLYRLGLYAPEVCEPGPTVLCLNEGRFRVETNWRTPQGDTGVGQAFELTEDSGFFWFFNPENIEVVVKVLNGCFDPYNHFWVFAAGLTNVEVEMVVTDTETGLVRRYDNPLNMPFQPIQDTRAFDTCP